MTIDGSSSSSPKKRNTEEEPPPAASSVALAKLYIPVTKELAERLDKVLPKGMKTRTLVATVEQLVELLESSKRPHMTMGAVIDGQVKLMWERPE